jgi:hypothetical protein
MSNFENRRDARRERWEKRKERHTGNGHIWTGVLLLLIGGAALLRNYLPDFPNWLFSWQMLLITLGLFVGFRHRFRGVAWFILLLIGGTFMANEFFLEDGFRLNMWPIILIAAGLFFIFRSREHTSCGRPGKPGDPESGGFMNTETFSQDDFIDSTCIFSGAKKNILSKNFKGGDIVNVFGGTELNLTQADIEGSAVLELTTIFGGTKLIVPSNWVIKSEAVTIFGGIEDKRQLPAVGESPGKVLYLKGTVIFGGIDIKSF